MELKKDISLRNFTTLKIGGKAKYMCHLEDLADLEKKEFLRLIEGNEVFILGGGSNTAFSDFDGVVISTLKYRGWKIVKNTPDSIIVQVKSGTPIRSLMGFCIENNLSGLESFFLFPA
jgi:UDP-N-acetylmuramate dehydrogenase